MPGIPWMFGDERPIGSRTPLLGEHSYEIRSQSKEIWTDPDKSEQPRPTRKAPRRPLDGLRVIDLSMFMSGPMTSLVFADGGADVIKVESVQRIDGWRAGGSSEKFWWEWAPQFNWVNRNKHGITLNLTDQRGSDVIRQMVNEADILVENYTPRVMGNFGLSYDELREINPELIMISMPGFGLTGTWSHYTAFANTTEQMSGLPHLTGYADDQPIFSGTTGGDPLAGVMGALALLSALERRRRLNAKASRAAATLISRRRRRPPPLPARRSRPTRSPARIPAESATTTPGSRRTTRIRASATSGSRSLARPTSSSRTWRG